MKKRFIMTSIVVGSFILSSCGQKESIESENVGEDSYKRPPTLFLATSDIMIEKVEAQTYNWVYTDPIDHKEQQNVADSLPPSKIVSIDKPVKVKEMRYLTVGFEPMPQYYRLILLDRHNERIATYSDVSNIKEHGTYILEVDATFDKGKAQYYIPIKFPKQ